MSQPYSADNHESIRDNTSVQGNLVVNGGFEDRKTFFGWEKSSGVF